MADWELLGAFLSQQLGHPLACVALPHPESRVNRLFAQRRTAGMVRIITVGEHTIRECLNALKSGWTLGLLGDHRFGAPGVAVPLFGSKVLLPVGPALLCWRSRVPLVPIFMLREGQNRFRIHMDEPIWPNGKTSGFRQASMDLMGGFAKAFERMVRQAPEQWLLFKPLEVSLEGESSSRRPVR